MSFPPPCTIIGFNPTDFKTAISFKTLFLMISFVMALPPYLMTTISPSYFCIYPKASTNISALLISFVNSCCIIFPPTNDNQH